MTLSCVRGKHKPAAAFWCRDLDLEPMTLKLHRDQSYLNKQHTESTARHCIPHTVVRSSHCKGLSCEKSSEGQRSRSNVINLQPHLAFTMGHTPTKLHRFPASNLVSKNKLNNDNCLKRSLYSGIGLRRRRRGNHIRCNKHSVGHRILTQDLTKLCAKKFCQKLQSTLLH